MGAPRAIEAPLLAERAGWRRQGRRLVFASGCFDLLHAGPLAFLEQARALGDVLLVGVHADAAARARKGGERPLAPAAERAELLLALEAVDGVVIVAQEPPLEALRALEPDILVMGADWGRYASQAARVVEASGGRVVSVARAPAPSTAALLARIRRT